jgi:hypothetical protein
VREYNWPERCHGRSITAVGIRPSGVENGGEREYNTHVVQDARRNLADRLGGSFVKSIRFGAVAWAVVFLFLFAATEALAWGPATHIKLATDLLDHLALLPAALAPLLARHRRYFIFGSVATDTVLAKKMTRVKQLCHRWSTGFSLLETARTDAGRAFAYGYLAHLAADTVAHNKFIPRQLAVSRSTLTFGHLYWEIRADSLIDTPCWQELRQRLRGRYPEPERLLRSHLTQTLLSYGTNRLLFRRMNMISSLAAWRRSVEFWSRLSRFQLDPVVVKDYHGESLERILDVLSNGATSSVLHEDPNGNSALSAAKAQRRLVRRMRWAGVPHSYVIRETALGHAPRNGAASSIRAVAH